MELGRWLLPRRSLTFYRFLEAGQQTARFLHVALELPAHGITRSGVGAECGIPFASLINSSITCIVEMARLARVVALAGEELGAVLLEGVGDVFEEDEPEDDVLVSAASMLLRSLSAVSQSLASKPRLAVEALSFAGRAMR